MKNLLYFTICMLLGANFLLSCAAFESDSELPRPEPDFWVFPNNNNALQIEFDAFPSVGADTYEWIFGDSTKSEGKKTSKLFKKAGVYDVTLKITGREGSQKNNQLITRQITKRIQIGKFSQNIKIDVNPNDIHTKTNASFSINNNSIKEYYWLYNNSITSYSPVLKRGFANLGKNTIQVVVNDTANISAMTNLSFVVRASTVRIKEIDLAGFDCMIGERGTLRNVNGYLYVRSNNKAIEDLTAVDSVNCQQIRTWKTSKDIDITSEDDDDDIQIVIQANNNRLISDWLDLGKENQSKKEFIIPLRGNNNRTGRIIVTVEYL